MANSKIDEELTIDCKNVCCFLCFRGQGCDGSNRPKFTTFSLHDFTHYLNLDCRKMFIMTEEARSKLERAQVAVPVCEECCKVTQRFQSLQNLLKNVVYNLNANARRICEFVERAEKDVSKRMAKQALVEEAGFLRDGVWAEIVEKGALLKESKQRSPTIGIDVTKGFLPTPRMGKTQVPLPNGTAESPPLPHQKAVELTIPTNSTLNQVQEQEIQAKVETAGIFSGKAIASEPSTIPQENCRNIDTPTLKRPISGKRITGGKRMKDAEGFSESRILDRRGSPPDICTFQSACDDPTWTQTDVDLASHQIQITGQAQQQKLFSFPEQEIADSVAPTAVNGVVCFQCGFLFKAQCHLLRHLLTECRGELHCDVASLSRHRNCPCHPCSARFAVYKRNTALKHHLITCHGDEILQDLRKDSIPPPKFKEIIAHLLFKDFIQDGSKSCSLCPKTWNDKNLPLVVGQWKQHLLQDHYDELAKSLAELQENASVDIMLRNGKFTGRHCPCGAYVPSKNVLAAHQHLHCPLTPRYFSNERACEIDGNGNYFQPMNDSAVDEVSETCSNFPESNESFHEKDKDDEAELPTTTDLDRRIFSSKLMNHFEAGSSWQQIGLRESDGNISDKEVSENFYDDDMYPGGHNFFRF